jgi:hypothetical protein
MASAATKFIQFQSQQEYFFCFLFQIQSIQKIKKKVFQKISEKIKFKNKFKFKNSPG